MIRRMRRTSPDWAAFGRLGGLKRAHRLPKDRREALARAAALARHARTSQHDRSEHARMMAEARWAKRRAT